MMAGKAQKIALYALFYAGVKQPIKVYEESTREYEELKRQGIDFIHPGELDYPAILMERQTDLPPFFRGSLLFFRGSLRLLQRQSVAIVGSRNASELGLRCAYLLAQALAERGVNIISGYARGIDTQAHLGALESERGATTIVLAEGISHFKPKGEFQKLEGWEERTLVLSQFKPSERWSARNAMIRNWLICALANAVIVVESGPERDENGKMSGAFDAGKKALKLKVPLFVVYYEGQSSLNDGSSLPNLPEGNRQLIELIEKEEGAKKDATRLRIDISNLEESAKEAACEVLKRIRQEGEAEVPKQSTGGWHERCKPDTDGQPRLIPTHTCS